MFIMFEDHWSNSPIISLNKLIIYTESSYTSALVAFDTTDIPSTSCLLNSYLMPEMMLEIRYTVMYKNHALASKSRSLFLNLHFPLIAYQRFPNLCFSSSELEKSTLVGFGGMIKLSNFLDASGNIAWKYDLFSFLVLYL